MPSIHLNILNRFICIGLFVLLQACALPENQTQLNETKTSITPASWEFDQATQEKIAQGLTAYLTLDHGFNSIAARLYAIHHAKHHLDLQYYIWKDDAIGQMMLHALLNAADRGVSIRILIDDQNGTALDETLQALAVHPNIKIRIFNPYKYRNLRVIDYLFRFKAINQRMHNKLLIADGSLVITGGRNISSEYFDASKNYQFVDLDVLFFGDAAQAANVSFQKYWQHELSYSIQQITGIAQKSALKKLRQTYLLQQPSQKQLNQQLLQAEKALSEDLNRQQHGWTKAHFVADLPEKITGQVRNSNFLYRQLQQHMGQAKQRLDIVSAYFVPTQQGVDQLSTLVENGVKVNVLTNSYLANDVPVVHAFYQKYRKELLQKGIHLYEFKPYLERPQRTWYEVVTGNIIPAKSKNASRLHAKFFTVDQNVYIGSFNFDPRSTDLNTEVGLILNAARLQEKIQTDLAQYLPQVAYELRLDEHGEIIWLEQDTNGKTLIHKTEPQTTKFQRFMFKSIAYTPFEWVM